MRPNLFVGRPPLRGRAESGGQKGKAFAEEMGNLPRCPPLCLRAAPLPPGRAKNGREAGKEFTKERENIHPLSRSVCAPSLPRSHEKMGGRRVGRSRKKGGTFPFQYVLFAGLAKNGSRAGKAFMKEIGNLPRRPPCSLRAAPLPPCHTKNGREAGEAFAKERGILPLALQFVCGPALFFRPHKKWKARGEGVDARKGILPLALHYVCGPPLPSRAHEEWEANGEAVRKKGRPLRCAPICLRGAHSVAGVRRLGD